MIVRSRILVVVLLLLFCIARVTCLSNFVRKMFSSRNNSTVSSIERAMKERLDEALFNYSDPAQNIEIIDNKLRNTPCNEGQSQGEGGGEEEEGILSSLARSLISNAIAKLTGQPFNGNYDLARLFIWLAFQVLLCYFLVALCLRKGFNAVFYSNGVRTQLFKWRDCIERQLLQLGRLSGESSQTSDQPLFVARSRVCAPLLSIYKTISKLLCLILMPPLLCLLSRAPNLPYPPYLTLSYFCLQSYHTP